MSVKINVQGTIFETTFDTLKKINLFKYMIEATDFNSSEPLFINRPAHMFKHVLALVTIDDYSYPLKYKEELEFYDINYNIKDLYDPNNCIEHLSERIDCIVNDVRNIREKIDNIDQQKLNEIDKNISGVKYRICPRCHFKFIMSDTGMCDDCSL